MILTGPHNLGFATGKSDKQRYSDPNGGEFSW